MPFVDQLFSLIQDTTDGNVAGFSRLCGIKDSSVRQYLEGTEPTLRNLIKIAHATDVSLDWLAEGKETHKSVTVEGPGQAFALLPRFEVRASAGQGLVAVSEQVAETLAFRRDWLSRLGVNPQNAGLVTAEGDSMAPTIPNGAIMLVDISIQDARNGLIYVMVRDGEVLVKRIQVKADRSLVLISDNERYERETISREQLADFHIAGRVVWVGHSV